MPFRISIQTFQWRVIILTRYFCIKHVWQGAQMIPHTHTHTQRGKEQLSRNPVHFYHTHTHTHTHNYELMRPERKNEGHVQLEMKHKSSTICLFVQTRATHTHRLRGVTHDQGEGTSIPQDKLFICHLQPRERETSITRCFLQGLKEKCFTQINHGRLVVD